MLLLIDNYDSFVHNLGRYFRRLGQDTLVVRNDALTAADVRRLQPHGLVFSPGPGAPADAGYCLELIRELHEELPMLGVCLGHQALAEAVGGRVVRSPQPMHGRASWVRHAGRRLFDGLPNPLRVGRYHSLVVAPGSLPEMWQVTAETEDGIIMAIEHGERPLFGVQFHPESVLTTGGYRLLANFLAALGLPPEQVPADDWTPLELAQEVDPHLLDAQAAPEPVRPIPAVERRRW